MISFSGSHLKSHLLNTNVIIEGETIVLKDIEKALEFYPNFPNDQEVIQVIPLAYWVDQQTKVRNPLGLFAKRLETQIHVITAGKMNLMNQVRGIERCGIKVEGVVPHALSSALACLTEDEKKLNTVVLDIGAGTTDIAIFREGTLNSVAVIPLGGNLITQDIATLLRTSLVEAERLKMEYGFAKVEQLYPSHHEVECGKMGGDDMQKIEHEFLVRVIESRLQELFDMVKQHLQKCGVHFQYTNLVLTGGTSLLSGIVELAQEHLQMPSRLAFPHFELLDKHQTQDPKLSGLIGLICYIQDRDIPIDHNRQNLNLKWSFTSFFKSFKGVKKNLKSSMNWINEKF
jgi:cell division protein FtsA